MSRAWLPRRLAAGLAVLATACCCAAAAFADAGPTVTILLDPTSHARACAEFASVLDRSDAAVARCNRAVRVETGNEVNLGITYINRGNIRLARSEYTLALADFDAAIALNEANAEAHLNRGVALIAMEQFGAAVVALTEAVSLGVHEPHKAYYNRAAAREALGDFRGALEDYTTALAIEPDWGMADAEQQRLARVRSEQIAEHLQD